jgi:hypothetical protein
VKYTLVNERIGLKNKGQSYNKLNSLNTIVELGVQLTRLKGFRRELTLLGNKESG